MLTAVIWGYDEGNLELLIRMTENESTQNSADGNEVMLQLYTCLIRGSSMRERERERERERDLIVLYDDFSGYSESTCDRILLPPRIELSLGIR